MARKPEMQEATMEIPVAIRIDYAKAEITSIQVWVNNDEQDVRNNPIKLDLRAGTMYHLRWYFAGKNEAKVTFYFILPQGIELRIPGEKLPKAPPAIEAAIGKTPSIRDTNGRQRFHLRAAKKEAQ